MTFFIALRAELGDLWRTHRPLTAAGLSMFPMLAFSLFGLWLDPTLIGGAPAWLKPAKFAASIAIYSLTLVWMFRYLPQRSRTRSVVGGVTALVVLLEMAIIVVQAARGRPSHFNASTPLDSALFTLMGAAIVTQTSASVAVAVALWRTPFEDRALGWALRLGLVITILGAFLGGAMGTPRHDQIEALKAGVTTPMGAHTVGAPDGGPALPVTGWSRTHGDLRVAHFIGLHALQALPLLAFALRRRQRPEPARRRLVLVAAASYASLFGILVWQALRAQSVVAPDTTTLGALALWLVLTVTASRQALVRESSNEHAPLAIS